MMDDDELPFNEIKPVAIEPVFREDKINKQNQMIADKIAAHSGLEILPQPEGCPYEYLLFVPEDGEILGILKVKSSFVSTEQYKTYTFDNALWAFLRNERRKHPSVFSFLAINFIDGLYYLAVAEQKYHITDGTVHIPISDLVGPI